MRGAPEPGDRALRVLARLVPPPERREWLLEWMGELHHARRAVGLSAALDRLRVYAAAAEDAARLRGRLVARMAVGTDLRFAFRSLRLNRGYALVAVLTLAIGIGANAAIFSVVNAYLLRPLPLDEPERLVVLSKAKGGRIGATSAPNFLDWREQSSSFSTMSGLHLWAATLTGVETPKRLSIARVTPGFFPMLGSTMALGRGFTEDEGSLGQNRVVVLSYEQWTAGFGADPGVIGRTVVLNGESFEVVGVAPAGLSVPPFTSDLYAPLAFEPDALEARGRNNLYVLARLAAGASLSSASAEMTVIGQNLSEAYPDANDGWGIELQQLHGYAVGPSALGLWMLFAAVGLVLLIACVNVANLTIARGIARTRELAVRVALGASRGRLLRQLLAESLVLSLLGGGLGIAIAYALMDPIASLIPGRLMQVGDVSLDGSVLAFALVASLLTALLAGLVPAFRMAGDAAGGRGPGTVAGALTNRGGSRKVRGALVVSEFALAMMLLVGAGLFIRTLSNLYSVDLGVAHEGVTTFSVSFPDVDYPEPQDVIQGVDRLREELSAQPDVEMVAATSHLPLSGARLTSSVIYEGGPQEHGVNTPSGAIKVVTPGYFDAMGIPLISGRFLTRDDESGAEPVVVINRTAAQLYWPGEDAVGRWLSYNNVDHEPVRRRVVGVIGDVHYAGPSRPPMAEVYQSHLQTADVWRWFGRGMSYVARTRSGNVLALQAVQESLGRVDPRLPVVGLRSLTEVLDGSVEAPRFLGTLVGLFATLALLLAVVGTYGVMAFSVRQRTREIGIRVAMGAGRRTVLGGVLVRGLRLAAVGTVVGTVGAVLVSRSVSSLFWGVSGTDLVTYVSVALVLILATVGATLVPALRASRVDPMVALRAE